jgi:hypothetical protein
MLRDSLKTRRFVEGNQVHYDITFDIFGFKKLAHFAVEVGTSTISISSTILECGHCNDPKMICCRDILMSSRS